MLQRFVEAASVEAEIARVRSLSGDALRRRWQSVFGRAPPDSLTPDLLRRMIAARVQEEAFGTLDGATLKLLDGLARREGARTAERNLKIGTVLVRDYQGRRHTVTVEPDGYVWEGNPYSSLSAIARAITGTAPQSSRCASHRTDAPPVTLGATVAVLGAVRARHSGRRRAASEPGILIAGRGVWIPGSPCGAPQ
jgi:hypothetical protein